MIKTKSKIITTGLLLGLGIQVGYGAEKQHNPFPQGAFVRYSTNESIGKFTLSSENNMADLGAFKVAGDVKLIKSMYLDHSDERDCIPPRTRDYIRKFLPELVEFTVYCPRAQQIDFGRFHSEKLKTLSINTQAKNLNESLEAVPDSFPNLENIGIHSNQLNIVGVLYISLLEKLKTFTCSTYRHTLHKNALIPLAHMENLKRVNYGSWENTGGYTVLIDLYKERQKAALPPLTLGDARSDHIYDFKGCKIPLGPNLTLIVPGTSAINAEKE